MSLFRQQRTAAAFESGLGDFGHLNRFVTHRGDRMCVSGRWPRVTEVRANGVVVAYLCLDCDQQVEARRCTIVDDDLKDLEVKS